MGTGPFGHSEIAVMRGILTGIINNSETESLKINLLKNNRNREFFYKMYNDRKGAIEPSGAAVSAAEKEEIIDQSQSEVEVSSADEELESEESYSSTLSTESEDSQIELAIQKEREHKK